MARFSSTCPSVAEVVLSSGRGTLHLDGGGHRSHPELNVHGRLLLDFQAERRLGRPVEAGGLHRQHVPRRRQRRQDIAPGGIGHGRIVDVAVGVGRRNLRCRHCRLGVVGDGSTDGTGIRLAPGKSGKQKENCPEFRHRILPLSTFHVE